MKRRVLKRLFLILIPLLLFGGVALLIQQGVIVLVNPSVTAYPVRGVDVSHHQGQIDWSALTAGQGFTFAFVKASEGADFTDPNYPDNILNSRRQGLYAAPYHYFSQTSSGREQAAHFLEVIADSVFDLPPVLDFELTWSKESDWAGVRREVNDFLTAVEDALGVKPIIRTTNAGYNGFLCEDFEDYRFWIRDLWAMPSLFNNQIWTFWQYSDKGRLDGVPGPEKNVDLNVFNGSLDTFERLFNVRAAAQKP